MPIKNSDFYKGFLASFLLSLYPLTHAYFGNYGVLDFFQLTLPLIFFFILSLTLYSVINLLSINFINKIIVVSTTIIFIFIYEGTTNSSY